MQQQTNVWCDGKALKNKFQMTPKEPHKVGHKRAKQREAKCLISPVHLQKLIAGYPDADEYFHKL